MSEKAPESFESVSRQARQQNTVGGACLVRRPFFLSARLWTHLRYRSIRGTDAPSMEHEIRTKKAAREKFRAAVLLS